MDNSTFLEIEHSRLEKLQRLFREKLPQSEQASHNLYQRQLARRNELRQKLARMMANPDSSFQRNLRKFFEQAF